MKLITIVTAILLFAGCSQPSKKKLISSDHLSFVDYLKSLDTISLPFSHACTGSNLLSISRHFDAAGFKKYGDKDCAEPLGILFNDNDNVVLVDISNADDCKAPFLVSFDKKGDKIDVLNLYGDGFQDETSALMPFFKISKNKKIVVIDTLKKWKADPTQDKPSDSVSIKIDSTVYALSKNGKFIVVSLKK